MNMYRPGCSMLDGARHAFYGRSCACDHVWVNAVCLGDSRTEGGKGSLNE